VAALARPALDRIADAAGDTAFASVREGPTAVRVARAVGAFPIKTLALGVGDRRPLGVGAGSLALLSGLDDGAVRRAIGANAHGLRGYPGFGAAELPALVERTRRDGYALNEGRLVAVLQKEAGRPEAEIRSGGGRA
jgi:DNA-binding IclR family transcriptional regulator